MQSAELVKDILQKWELHTDAVKGLECRSTGYHPCFERDEMTASSYQAHEPQSGNTPTPAKSPQVSTKHGCVSGSTSAHQIDKVHLFIQESLLSLQTTQTLAFLFLALHDKQRGHHIDVMFL